MVPKLRFRAFSKEYNIRKLKETADIVTGNTPSTSNSKFYGGEYMFVSPVDINEEKFVSHTKTTVSKEGFINGREIPAYSVMFVCIGSTIGKLAINSHPCITNQQINSLICNAYFSANYLYYILEKHSKKIKELAGIQAVPLINKTTFSNVELYFPNTEEQTKVASFISSVDEKITLLNKQYILLCQYKKGMMQKIFSQEVRFKDDDGTTFPDWENQKLGDVAVFLKGKGVAKTDVVEYGERECIRYGELYTDYGEVIRKIKSRTNQSLTDSILSMSRDVLVPSSGETAIDISKASCVLSDGVILGGDLNIIRSKAIDGMFLSYYINSQKKYEIAQMAQGNSVVHLYAKQLAKTEIFYPCKKEQTKIANFLSALDDKITTKKAELDKLKTWKQGLLQQMFV
ncbi:restriction endonuclease subunit S [Enterobacter quasiroggenkampii]|uniref:restriction endonuclease subunit S n=1 Tax=Enterobacter quasiroggenkampii TaxID=2497436 RepID=UPI0021D3C8AB|nr:restriction endonuclease subunit S [Enterobacter quasiroggenkampii]